MNIIIQSPTPNKEQSIKFYQKLGFEIIQQNNSIFATDGKAIVQINPDNFARAGVKLFAENWESTINTLDPGFAYVKIDQGYILSDPSGCWIYLIENTDNIPLGLPESPPAVPGKYAGISMESLAFEQSIQLWEHLGFKVSLGAKEHGWICLTNSNGESISIMKALSSPHLFFNPSLTYFNSGNNPEIISKIRELHIPITEEITVFNSKGIVDNIIIRDPGGLGFFIFND